MASIKVQLMAAIQTIRNSLSHEFLDARRFFLISRRVRNNPLRHT